MPKFRFLIIIYRAFLLKADVPDTALNRLYLSFKRERFSSCLIVAGKEPQAIAALCLNERRACSVLGLDTTIFNDFLRL